MGRRILVIGGRDNYDWLTVDKAIWEHCRQGDILVHGAASGIDSIAMQIALYNPDFFDHDPFPAEWKPDGKFDPLAGHKRNQQMIESGISGALVFAGGTGTADCLDRIIKAGIKYYDYSAYWMGVPRG